MLTFSYGGGRKRETLLALSHLQFLPSEPSATHALLESDLTFLHLCASCLLRLCFLGCFLPGPRKHGSLQHLEVSDSGEGSQRGRKHKKFHFREERNISSAETETDKNKIGNKSCIRIKTGIYKET